MRSDLHSMALKATALGCMALLAGMAGAVTVVLEQPVIVSAQLPDGNAAYKGKMVSQVYASSIPGGLVSNITSYDVRATTIVYADASAYGGRDIWVARSADNGVTWSTQALTANAGTPLKLGDFDLLTTNGKPNIYAPATGALNASGKGANILVTWTSSYCLNADGSGPSPVQKVNLNLDTGPQPYMCLWTARSVDGGVTWTKQQVTDGALDVDEDVPAGYVSANLGAGGFGIVWQADPAGLKQGQAEGPGEGASGASVSQGTNIWYSHLTKAAFEAGSLFPAYTLSDNDPVTNAKGASRPNLAIVGGTAIVAYEETKGDSESFGKQIIYHSFPYAAPALNSAGTVVSDPAFNARRVRFLSQGDASAGPSPLRLVLLWRQTDVNTPGAPSDVMALRGLKGTPPSTGFLPTYIEHHSLARNLSHLLGQGAADNALAQRGALRGSKVAVGFDYTPDAAAAVAVPPVATYNFYVTRSLDSGASWALPTNLSKITDYSVRALEPRLVGTPGSIVLPNGQPTGLASDLQAPDTFYIAWGTETNSATPLPLDIWMQRTPNFGAKYEAKRPLAVGGGASEAQLRLTPDGMNVQALWMQTTGVVTDVHFRTGVASK